jgi:hypothetical protein
LTQASNDLARRTANSRITAWERYALLRAQTVLESWRLDVDSHHPECFKPPPSTTKRRAGPSLPLPPAKRPRKSAAPSSERRTRKPSSLPLPPPLRRRLQAPRK